MKALEPCAPFVLPSAPYGSYTKLSIDAILENHLPVQWTLQCINQLMSYVPQSEVARLLASVVWVPVTDKLREGSPVYARVNYPRFAQLNVLSELTLFPNRI